MTVLQDAARLAMFLDRPAAIVGTTGAGKSFAAKGAVEHLLSLGRRVIIIDPTGAWYGLRAGADGSPSGGFPVLIFGGYHADVRLEPTAEAGKALALALAERDVQAIIDTSEMTGGEKNRFLTPFLENLYAKNKAALHLIVDEADEVAAQNLADGEQRLFGAFDKIVRRGRIKGFRPLMISQRPAVIHKNVLSQIGTLIALKLTSPQDRKAVNEWVKGNADADQARAVMTSLPTLQRGEGWVWSPADDVLERVMFPPIRTFDSSRTPQIGEVLTAPALAAVDVKALREAMIISSSKNEGAKSARATANVDIDAAEKRAYDNGYKDGYFAARNALTKMFADRVSAVAEDIRSNGGGKPSDIAVPITIRAPNTPAPFSAEKKPVVVAGLEPVANFPRTVPAADLPPSLQKALDSVAWWRSIGFDEVARNRAAITAGLSPTASTFGVYVSKLVERGLLEVSTPGHIRLTDAGVAQSVIPASLDVHTSARALLEPQPARVFDLVIGVHPEPISRGDLADLMGLSRSASTLGVYLAKVSRLGFIQTLPGSLVKAADFLFSGGKIG
ncbi:DUF853 family protein [Mesorhizobium sp. NBSH29]|nr:DUF853 family protein [Mesorhizobium sp. NBSH29]